MSSHPRQTALITGGARRIGARIAGALHAHGMDVIVHYRRSRAEARALVAQLNRRRADSARAIQAELRETESIRRLAAKSVGIWGRIDALINNASVFPAVGLDGLSERSWDEVMDTNVKAPLFLSAALAEELRRRHGCIINLSDIHAQRPLKNFLLYCISKAGLDMLTKAAARELAPAARCNAIAPGAIDWPESDADTKKREAIIEKIALKRSGEAQDLAQAVLFLIQAKYMTGQIISLDGGRTLSQ